MAPAQRWLSLARVAFLAVGGYFIWRGLDGRGTEIRNGLEATSVPALIGAFGLVLLGLVLTAALWRQILALFGHRTAVVPAFEIFFVGQLGKYIPGSVWSFGAQAIGARRLGIPTRTTLSASMVFLGIHLASALVLGPVLAVVSGDDPGLPLISLAALFLVGTVALTPGLVRRLAGRVSQGTPLVMNAADELRLLAIMACAWGAYAAALVILGDHLGADSGPLLVAAFMLSYAAGVVVFLAPAGIGARETTFVLMVGPEVGTGAAIAVALLSRVVMTAADVVLAIAASLAAKRTSLRDERD